MSHDKLGTSHDKLVDILKRRGQITEAQARQALVRQKSRGGRIGSHLLYYRFVTEEQLVRALSEQHEVPGIALEGRKISEEALKRLPVTVVDEYQMLPFDWDPKSQTLHVAMADPANGGISTARRVGRCTGLKAYVAVDSVLRGLIAGHYHGGREVFRDQIIELPALFADDQAPANPAARDATVEAAPRVLMISRTAFLKNFLISIFVREGYELEMLSDPQQIAASMRNGNIVHILVAKDMEEQFAEWVRSGVLATPRVELSIFGSVSGSLLENPAPYKAVTGSLIRALLQMAELRCAASAWKPPFAQICEDLRNLAAALGLRRLAVDGLQVAAHLLVPAVDAATGTAPARQPDAPDAAALAFTDFDRSLEIAQALRFPWDVEACLVSFSHLNHDIVTAKRDAAQKVSLAAQILGIVWYRHSAFRHQQPSLATLKAELRQQASRLAAPEVVEAYVRLLEQGAEPTGADPILLVGAETEIAKQLSVHLKYGGYRVVEVDDLAEAAKLAQRLTPAVVFVDHQRFALRALELCRQLKSASGVLVYAFSGVDKPSLVMDLLDAGFDDAYVPPFNFNLLVTRLGKTLEMRAGRQTNEPGFRGTLQELPFVDLVQALSGSQRNVQVSLQQAGGERATLTMRRGQIVHCTCGPVSGPDAVYRIIAWRDHGQFSTTSVQSFPPDNIAQSNDSLLFEGCRLLDEARR